jgi:hypothetical protein
MENYSQYINKAIELFMLYIPKLALAVSIPRQSRGL